MLLWTTLVSESVLCLWAQSIVHKSIMWLSLLTTYIFFLVFTRRYELLRLRYLGRAASAVRFIRHLLSRPIMHRAVVHHSSASNKPHHGPVAVAQQAPALSLPIPRHSFAPRFLFTLSERRRLGWQTLPLPSTSLPTPPLPIRFQPRPSS